MNLNQNYHYRAAKHCAMDKVLRESVRKRVAETKFWETDTHEYWIRAERCYVRKCRCLGGSWPKVEKRRKANNRLTLGFSDSTVTFAISSYACTDITVK